MTKQDDWWYETKLIKMSFTIKSHSGKYSVKIIKKINQKNLKKDNNFYIVDSSVYKIFLKKKLNKNFVLVNSSEKNKDYFEIGKIMKKIILLGIKRNSNLIAIGEALFKTSQVLLLQLFLGV